MPGKAAPPPPRVPQRKKPGRSKGEPRHQQREEEGEEDAFTFTGEEGTGGGKGQRMSVRATMVRLSCGRLGGSQPPEGRSTRPSVFSPSMTRT